MRFKRFSDKSLRRPYWDYRKDGAYFITICTKNRVRYFGEVIEGKMELSSLGVIANTLWNEIPEHTRNCRLGAFVIMPDHVHGILILKNNGGDSQRSVVACNDAPNQTKINNSISQINVNAAPNPTNINKSISQTNGNAAPNPTNINNSISQINVNDAPNPTNINNSISQINVNDAPNRTKINNSISQDSFDISIEKYHPSDFARFKKNLNVMSQISPKANSISAIIRSYKSAVTKKANELGYCFQWQSRFHDRLIRDKRAYWVISRYIENNPKKWGKMKELNIRKMKK